jgi:hypothetical protein
MLVPSQVLQFADLRSDGFQPAKLLFYKEQKNWTRWDITTANGGPWTR